jgi:hypothetical protein
LIEVANAGRARFFVEFELGKWLLPNIGSSLATRSFALPFAQFTCDWMTEPCRPALLCARIPEIRHGICGLYGAYMGQTALSPRLTG